MHPAYGPPTPPKVLCDDALYAECRALYASGVWTTKALSDLYSISEARVWLIIEFKGYPNMDEAGMGYVDDAVPPHPVH